MEILVGCDAYADVMESTNENNSRTIMDCAGAEVEIAETVDKVVCTSAYIHLVGSRHTGSKKKDDLYGTIEA